LTEAFSEERLWQLGERWRREPTSRIFVQLAEEYRRGGRYREALGVLEQGLVHHPGYVSALVVLGRCRLDAGDAPGAVEAFDRALAQDPAQLVANKFLVEAYLRAGQPDRAQQRLDFYRLLNDRDAEIEDLARRIAAARGAAASPPPAPALPSPTPARPSPLPPPAPVRPEPAPIFDLGPVPARAPALELPRLAVAPARGPVAARTPAPFGELHEPAAARRRIVHALAAGGLFPMALAPAEPAPAVVTPAAAAVAAAPVTLAPAPEVAPEPAPAPEPLPWWRGMPESFAPAEEAAAAAAPAEPPGAEAAAPSPAPEPVEAVPPPWGAGARAAPELDLEARAEVVAAPFSPRSIGEEVERETIEEPFDEVLEASSTATALPRPMPEPPLAALSFEPVAEEPPAPLPEFAPVPEPPSVPLPPPEPAPAPPPPPVAAVPTPAAPEPVGPSATLGELYLQQGFVDEAEREFRAVLEVRPGEAMALAGLEEIGRRRAGERPEAPAPRTLPAGLTRRKIETLRGYLARLQRARGDGLVS